MEIRWLCDEIDVIIGEIRFFFDELKILFMMVFVNFQDFEITMICYDNLIPLGTWNEFF